MPYFRPLLVIVLTAGFVVAGSALAQTTKSPSQPARPSAAATEAFNAKAITARQWNRMKRRWMRDKARWAACNKLARDRKLRGRRSWPVIAQCMTR